MNPKPDPVLVDEDEVICLAASETCGEGLAPCCPDLECAADQCSPVLIN